MTVDEPAQQLEHQADELEHHLDELEDHIADAQKSASHLREQTNPETVGDFENTRGTPGQGDDPEGAAESAPAHEAETTSPEDAAANPRGSAGGDADDDDAPSDDSGDRSDSGAGDQPSSGDDEAVGGPTPGHAAGGDD